MAKSRVACWTVCRGLLPRLLWKKGREGVALKRFSHFNSFCIFARKETYLPLSLRVALKLRNLHGFMSSLYLQCIFAASRKASQSPELRRERAATQRAVRRQWGDEKRSPLSLTLIPSFFDFLKGATPYTYDVRIFGEFLTSPT